MARTIFRQEPIAADEIEAADVAAVRRLIEAHDAVALRIGIADGEQLALPPSVVSLLRRGLAALASERRSSPSMTRTLRRRMRRPTLESFC